MRNYIYQIGRLDQSMGLKDFRFQIDENNKITIESYLSSFALKEYLKKKDSIENIQIVLAYPVSAFFNGSLIKSEDLDEEFKKSIENIMKNKLKQEEYLSNPYNFYCNHPHIKNKNKEEVDFFILHSIGSYNTDIFKNIQFESKFEDIVLEILIDMIQRITPFELMYEDVNLYIDVSSGHNIYVSALLEATKIFQQYFYSLNIFQKRKLYVKLVICDPILAHKGPYDMHIGYELKFDTVLKIHLTAKEIKEKIVAKKVFSELENENKKDFRDRKNRLSNILDSYGYIYSSLKNGIPLALYQIEISKTIDNIDSLKDILNYCKQQLNKSWLKGSNLNYDDLLKSLYAVASVISYLKISEEKDIKYKEFVYLNEIKKNFFEDESSLLNILGYSVAKQLVANELNSYEKVNKNFDSKSVIDRVENQWIQLGKAMPYFDSAVNQGLNPRNFLAHAGFERTIVLVKKQDNKILIKYDNKANEDIKNILLNNL